MSIERVKENIVNTKTIEEELITEFERVRTVSMSDQSTCPRISLC